MPACPFISASKGPQRLWHWTLLARFSCRCGLSRPFQQRTLGVILFCWKKYLRVYLMDYLIPCIWSAVGIISNLVAFMFFAVFTQKQPDIPLRIYDTVDAASSVLSKLKTMGKNAWITELDFHLLSHYTHTIDTELREIFDYARFEKFWFTIVLTRFTSSQLRCSSHLLIIHINVALGWLNAGMSCHLR